MMDIETKRMEEDGKPLKRKIKDDDKDGFFDEDLDDEVVE